MLLFIFFCILFLLSPSWFQYISCYSLSVQGAAEMPWLISFNTSHVTLYLQQMVADADEVTFQYISCYSLSDSAYIRYLVVLCFNTSHVTLYRGMASTNGMERYVSIHLMLLFIYILPRNHLRMSVFQYISCYSLSSPFPPNLLYSKLVSIHLMLLFIGYTSKDSRRSRRVSIHLMLLFIYSQC